MRSFEQDNVDFTGMYRGSVVDTNDPRKLGRIRVRVFGVFEAGIPDSKLPWASPAMPIFAGAGSGFGHFAVPESGSQVWVFFEGGDFNQPVYWAEAPNAVHGLPGERTTNYPNRRVIETKAGLGVLVDDTSKLIKIIHPSGKYIQMDNSGSITISAEDITITGGNITISGTKIELNP